MSEDNRTPISISVRRLRNLPHTKAIIIFLATISGALALLVEFIPLKDIPLLREYVALVLKVVAPSTIASASSFPSSFEVYFSFAWMMIPFFIHSYWRWSRMRYGEDDGLLFIAKEKLGFGKRFLLLGLTPVWAGLLVAGWYGFNGSDSRIFHIGSSLWVLVLVGWIVPLAFSACIFLIAASIKKAFTGKI